MRRGVEMGRRSRRRRLAADEPRLEKPLATLLNCSAYLNTRKWIPKLLCLNPIVAEGNRYNRNVSQERLSLSPNVAWRNLSPQSVPALESCRRRSGGREEAHFQLFFPRLAPFSCLAKVAESQSGGRALACDVRQNPMCEMSQSCSA